MSVFLLLAPLFVITLRCGQNGFLIGALVAAAAIGLSKGHASAGVPLGLMVLKPHLAIALALHVLLARRWKVALVALAVVAGSSLVAALALGPAIWMDFLGAVGEASAFLAAGLYPFYRMVSVYAAARSLGFSASRRRRPRSVSRRRPRRGRRRGPAVLRAAGDRRRRDRLGDDQPLCL